MNKLSPDDAYEIYTKINFQSDEWTPEATEVVEIWANAQTAEALYKASDSIARMCNHLPWVMYEGMCLCGHIRSLAEEYESQ